MRPANAGGAVTTQILPVTAKSSPLTVMLPLSCAIERTGLSSQTASPRLSAASSATDCMPPSKRSACAPPSVETS